MTLYLNFSSSKIIITYRSFDIFIWFKIHDDNYLTLIQQHYYNLNFLSTCATSCCSESCHVRIFTYLSVAKRKQAKNSDDAAKIQIKSEKPTPFGGIFSGRGAI